MPIKHRPVRSDSIMVVGAIQKGVPKSGSQKMKDLLCFVLKPTLGTPAFRAALSQAFRKKFGEEPTEISPIRLVQDNWGNADPEQMVAQKAFYSLGGAAKYHWVAEADGVDVVRHLIPSGDGKIESRPEFQPPYDPSGYRYIRVNKEKDPRTGQWVAKGTTEVLCPWEDTLSIRFTIEGIWELLPAWAQAQFPYKMGFEFHTSAGHEFSELRSQLHGIRNLLFQDGRNFPCALTPLALRRQVKEIKKKDGEGGAYEVSIAPTTISLTREFELAYDNVLRGAQQYLLETFITGGKMLSAPALMLSGGTSTNAQADVNDALFDNGGATPPVVVKSAAPVPKFDVKPAPVDPNDRDAVVKEAMARYYQVADEPATYKAAQVMDKLCDFASVVGSAVQSRPMVSKSVDTLMSLAGDDIDQWHFENLVGYFWLTSAEKNPGKDKQNLQIDGKNAWVFWNTQAKAVSPPVITEEEIPWEEGTFVDTGHPDNDEAPELVF